MLTSRWIAALCSSGLLTWAGCASDDAARPSDPAPTHADDASSPSAPQQIEGDEEAGASPSSQPAAQAPASSKTETARAAEAGAAASPGDRAAHAVAALGLEGCDIDRGEPGTDEDGLFFAICGDGQLMLGVIDRAVTDPRIANVDALLGALVQGHERVPQTSMAKLAIGGRPALPTTVVQSPPGQGRATRMYILEQGLTADTRMVMCGWKEEADHEATCLQLLGEFVAAP